MQQNILFVRLVHSRDWTCVLCLFVSCVHYLYFLPWTLVVNCPIFLLEKNRFQSGCVRHVVCSSHWIISSVCTRSRRLQIVIYVERSNAKHIEVCLDASIHKQRSSWRRENCGYRGYTVFPIVRAASHRPVHPVLTPPHRQVRRSPVVCFPVFQRWCGFLVTSHPGLTASL